MNSQNSKIVRFLFLFGRFFNEEFPVYRRLMIAKCWAQFVLYDYKLCKWRMKSKNEIYIFKNRKNSSVDDFIHFGEPEETGLVVLTQLGVPGDWILDDVDVPGDCMLEVVELGLVDFLIIKGGGLGLTWN